MTEPISASKPTEAPIPALAGEEVRHEEGLTLVKRQSHWLNHEMVPAFDAMAAEALADGVKLQIQSCYRAPTHQAALWKQAVQKHGSSAKARAWVAQPGRSQHQLGRALDLDGKGNAHAWLRRKAGAFGFVQTMDGNPNHWEWQPSEAE